MIGHGRCAAVGSRRDAVGSHQATAASASHLSHPAHRHNTALSFNYPANLTHQQQQFKLSPSSFVACIQGHPSKSTKSKRYRYTEVKQELRCTSTPAAQRAWQTVAGHCTRRIRFPFVSPCQGQPGAAAPPGPPGTTCWICIQPVTDLTLPCTHILSCLHFINSFYRIRLQKLAC